MIDQTESYDKNKPVNRLILLFIFLLFIAFRAAWEGDVFRKPDVTSHHVFDNVLLRLRNTILDYIRDEKSGVHANYNDLSFATISNREAFISGLKEAIYKISAIRNIKGYFDADVFKILVQDNFCFIHADLNKAANYISRNPLKLRNALASYSAHYSKRIFETEGAIDILRTKGKLRGGRSFLGNFDMNSPVIFTEEMNDLYVLLFGFANDPPISLSAFP